MTTLLSTAHRTIGVLLCTVAFAGLITRAVAADLVAGRNWPSLAGDRNANRVGDSLTVQIYESATATNSTQNSTKKGGSFGGQISAGTRFNESGQLSTTGSLQSTGQTGRAGTMVAQISVVVDGIMPNGDLHVAGEQTLNINGERTHIRLKGRVRPSDISTGNTVLSTRLADAAIDYDGSGFVTQDKPGVVGRVFRWLGLI